MPKRKLIPPPVAKINQDIQPLITLPELDLFNHENLQISVQKVIEEEIMPVGVWDSKSEISFSLPGDSETFLDPNSLRLRISVKIVENDGVRFAVCVVVFITTTI